MTLKEGSKLGPYEILSPLGAGGMGEVYRAKDSSLGREIAIKVLPADVASSPDRLQRFEREAKTVAALNHPNIVTIFGIEESGGHRFIAMELVEGETLDRMIAVGGMPLAKIFDIAIPLADALAAAHEKGIIHRDLKPGNVMVTKEGRVKVLDFGLAKLTAGGQGGSSPDDVTMSAPLTGRGVVIGTVPYMSPEQLQGELVDHRTDLFSLGIMLYEMATGQRPFQGKNSASVTSSILRDTPRPLHELNGVLPRHLGRIIEHCLEKNAEERFQSAKDVRNELRALRKEVDSGSDLTESQSESESTSTPGSAMSAPAKRGELWIGVGVLAVVILFAAFWFGRDDLLDSTSETAELSVATSETTDKPIETVESPQPNLSPKQPANAKIMLAVLPFKNLGSTDDEYFADGISDEIRSRLAAIRNLGVISRSSAFQYKNSDKPNRQKGSELGVDYLIDGTIRWDRRTGGAGRVRITPELIRISDDRSLWSQPYNRVIDDIFEVQSDIAEQVIKHLKITLPETERQAIDVIPTQNFDAHHAFLRGLYYMKRLDSPREEYELAIQMFERAVSLDPDFAVAHAELAKAHSGMHHFGYDSTEVRAASSKAAVDRALELQPELSEANLALGYYHYRCHRDYGQALKALAIAEKDLPNDSRILALVGYIWRRQGKLEAAIDNMKRALDLSPLDANIALEIADAYKLLRRYADADRWFDRSISMDPVPANPYRSKAWNHWLWHGDIEKARIALEEMPRTNTPGTNFAWFQQELFEKHYPAALDELTVTSSKSFEFQNGFTTKAQLAGLVHHLMGESEGSREAYESARILLENEVKERPDDHRVRTSLGIVYAGLGRKKDAIREGKRGVELFPVSKDALVGPYRVWDLAFIYTMLGEHEAAMDKLEYLLSIPCGMMSVPMLRLDPRWDDLRGNPRYMELMREHGFGREPKSQTETRPPSEKTRLAILPFTDNSPKPQEWLASGLADAISTRLGRVNASKLGVLGPETTTYYAQPGKSIKDLCEALNVDFVLRGSIQTIDNAVRITANLIRADDLTSSWSDEFNGSLKDPFVLQSKIAEKIISGLPFELTGEEKQRLKKRYTANSDAELAYMQGRFLTPGGGGVKKLLRAVSYFEQAIEIDPEYALAYCGLVDAKCFLATWGPLRTSDIRSEVKLAVAQALALDESLAEVHVSAGVAAMYLDWDWAEADAAFARAIQRDRNFDGAYDEYGYLLTIVGRNDEAKQRFEQAIKLNPVSLNALSGLGMLYAGLGRLTEAESLLQKVLEFDKDYMDASVWLADVRQKQRRFDDAVEIMERAVFSMEHPEIASLCFLGNAYAMAGRMDDARKQMAEMHKLKGQVPGHHMWFGELHAALGEKDEAFRRLDQALAAREAWLPHLRFDPGLIHIRSDPRFAELHRKMGLGRVDLSYASKLVPTVSEQKKKTMLAVLPFANLSGDPEQEYFSDGMTEEMITRLGRLRPELIGVIARTSAMRYKQTDKLIDQIGRELGVAYLIEGGVRRAGNSVRINAQLIQVSDQTQLWGDSYTRDLSDVFAVQAEVAEAIAESLAVKLLPEQQIARSNAPTESSAAYDAYLLGRSYWAKRTPQSLYTAIDHFKRASELDPNYTLAYSGLADTWGVLPFYVPGPYNEMNAEAMKAAERALALDSSLAEPHVSMAHVLEHRRDLEAANEHYRKAVAIDPNYATAHQWFGRLLNIQGKTEQAIDQYEKAITLDPLAAVMRLDYGASMRLSRRWDLAIDQLTKALDLQPDLNSAAIELMWAHLGMGDHAAAAAAFENRLTLLGQPPSRVAAFRRTYQSSGLKRALADWVELFRSEDSLPHSPAEHAEYLAWCGEKDRAFKWLERALQQQDPLISFIEYSFAYDNLRDDPRYVDLMKRISPKRKDEEPRSRP